METIISCSPTYIYGISAMSIYKSKIQTHFLIYHFSVVLFILYYLYYIQLLSENVEVYPI